MPRLFLIALAFMASGPTAPAQDVPYRFTVTVAEDGDSGAVAEMLRSRVARAAQTAGIAASRDGGADALFESAVTLTTLGSRVVRTPEPQVVLEVQIDVESRQLGTSHSHGSFSTEVRGFGRSESDALVSAVRASPAFGRALTDYFASVNDDITAYFSAACPSILGKAAAASREGAHQAAIFALSQIPPAAEPCWSEAQDLVGGLIDRSLEQQCSESMLRARARWSASRSRSSAREVADLLVQFYPGAHCDDEVEHLLAEVAETIAAHDRRAAERIRQQRAHALRVYEDCLTDRRARQGQQYRLARARIEAQRQVGVEMARSWARTNSGWRVVYL